VSGSGDRPVVVVMGSSSDDGPPGIDGIAATVDLRYAPDREELAKALPGAEVMLAWSGDTDDLRRAWAAADSLRWIQTGSVGVEWILFPELVESDVILTNVRGAADRPIAESVIGFIVAMAKGFPGMDEDRRRGVWRHEVMSELLEGSVLVVVGPGPIGRAIGRAAREGLGMRVRAVGRTARTGDAVFETVVAVDDLYGALAGADYVVDSLPLTPATRHLFDAGAFAAMKPTARFVNIGRGATVDEAALVEALGAGRIAGAALDVFETEPLPPESPLWSMDSVIVSPHRSGNVEGWDARFAQIFYDNLDRWLRGEPVINVVDKRLGFPSAE
jgi:phosphoglycerate dehydrogenase-like enzyme